jgi:long-chain acyl-CoA synthetase
MDRGKIGTLVDLLRERATESADRPAMRVKKGGAWRRLTYRQVARTAEEAAAGLVGLGVAPGDRVAILSENRPEWAFADLATLSAAAVDVPIYATNLPKQCEYILANSESVGAFVSSDAQLKKVLEVLPGLPKLRFVVCFDADPAACARLPLGEADRARPVVAWSDLCAFGRERIAKEPGVVEARRALVKQDDLCSIIYTSGTTGDPKGVILSHHNFIANVQGTLNVVPTDEDDVFLSFLPLCHVFERMGGYYFAMMAGAEIAYAESVDKVRDNLPEVQPTIMCSVPRLYEKIYAGVKENVEKSTGAKKKLGGWALAVGARRSEAVRAGRRVGIFLALQNAIADRLVFSKIRARMGGRLRFFVSGGAPLAREIAVFFHSIGVLILEGYGLTETSPVITCNRPTEFRLGTVGKALDGIEVKLAADGEILARGPSVTSGYYKNETATKESIDAEGWFHTGDIGEFDADGFLRITDRKKDLLKTSGGKYIAPQNIENEMKVQRTIGECVVIGDNRPYAAALIAPKFEIIEAFAREKGLAFADRAALVALPEVEGLVRDDVERVNKGLAQFEKVKKFRLLPRELSQDAGELTPTLKVKRKVVNQKWKDLIESMYAESKEGAAKN